MKKGFIIRKKKTKFNLKRCPGKFIVHLLNILSDSGNTFLCYISTSLKIQPMVLNPAIFFIVFPYIMCILHDIYCNYSN